MFSRIRTAMCCGVEGRTVYVETDVARGLPGIYIVGLASTTVMESRERIRSAIVNSGMDYPHGRITVNLTPASLRKNSSGFDLPIAVGILTAGLLVDTQAAESYGITGELSLDGRVLGVDGLLPMLLNMKDTGVGKIIIPESNMREALIISGIEVYPVRTLNECVALINGSDEISGMLRQRREEITEAFAPQRGSPEMLPDYADICGQEAAKRAVTIAVTGRHGLLMIGSPGCGKTMLASRIPTIMPPMDERELTETAIIYSVTGRNNTEGGIPSVRPFRHPHHTIGRAGLLGGGSIPVPGEISLAHNGVLFLDEVCEFDREKIEGLRIPIEEKRITHFRRGANYTFPCDFQLVMASNPCPCGYYGDSERMCKCSEAQLEQYRKKLSGPMMDRIDMKISMEKVEYDELSRPAGTLSSAEMAASVRRGIDFARETGRTVYNAAMSEADIERYCSLGPDEDAFMQRAYSSLGLSPRGLRRTLRVARTIADMDESAEISTGHLAEALSYRIIENVNDRR